MKDYSSYFKNAIWAQRVETAKKRLFIICFIVGGLFLNIGGSLAALWRAMCALRGAPAVYVQERRSPATWRYYKTSTRFPDVISTCFFPKYRNLDVQMSFFRSKKGNFDHRGRRFR